MKYNFKLDDFDRKKIISIGTAIFVLLFIISLSLVLIVMKKSEKTYIQYSDNKNLEYNVTLKENEYYKEPYIEKGNQYIADIIKFINADFQYNFNLPTHYNYNYKIVGVADIVDDKTNRTIYTISEDLLPEKTGESDGNLNINENITVEFDKYNNLIKQFINSYDLKNVTCKLSLNLNLDVDSSNQEFTKQKINAMSLDIPLAKNTIAIDTRYDLSNNTNLIELNRGILNSKPFIISASIIFLIDIIFLIIFIIYLKNTETDEEKYNKELKKIINNYDSYISRLEDEFNMQDYQILKVQSFSDLIEIRDTMQLPIIMLENKEQYVTCFVIPTPDKILYFYSLSVTQPALPSTENSVERVEK